MSITAREFGTVAHGIIIGGLFLLAYTGALAELWSLRGEWATAEGLRTRLRRLKIGVWAMMGLAWLTALSGAYLVFPWYRAQPPAGAIDLTSFPRAYLAANPDLRTWNSFGMDWKEHVAWLAPILATAVAYVVTRYGARLTVDRLLRQAVAVCLTLAFGAAGIAGLFGAFLAKVAPIR